LDNCSIYMAEATEVDINSHNVIWLNHPPDWPGLAPSAFYLFPTIKEKLKNIQMVDTDDLFSRLQELLNGISCTELDKVFDTWINRLMSVRQGDGVYILRRIQSLWQLSCFNHHIQLAQRLVDQTIAQLHFE
jgi:hypothetical protein